MNFVALMLMISFFLLTSSSSYSEIEQGSFDSQCRNQAKEAAVNSYQNCVKEVRTQKIDEIRKEYQEKLAELKNHYESELKKISPNTTKDKASEKEPDIEENSDVSNASNFPNYDSNSVKPKKNLKDQPIISNLYSINKRSKKSKKFLSQLPRKKVPSITRPVKSLDSPIDSSTEESEISEPAGSDANEL